jgi:hypothetical protein
MPDSTPLNPPQKLGCPILRVFCEGWDVNCSYCHGGFAHIFGSQARILGLLNIKYARKITLQLIIQIAAIGVAAISAGIALITNWRSTRTKAEEFLTELHQAFFVENT